MKLKSISTLFAAAGMLTAFTWLAAAQPATNQATATSSASARTYCASATMGAHMMRHRGMVMNGDTFRNCIVNTTRCPWHTTASAKLCPWAQPAATNPSESSPPPAK